MKKVNSSYWIPLSDMMMGLMMVFLLLSMIYMSKTSSLITEFEGVNKEIESRIKSEFEEDFKKWNAELVGDLTIRFKDTHIMFRVGSSKIKPEFAQLLDSFIPRYIAIVSPEKYQDTIKEVRIEGHTSTFWVGATDKNVAYIKNMDLSQDRTRETVKFVLNLPKMADKRDWLHKKLTANGLSSSHPIYNIEGSINEAASQRVEFKIITNAEQTVKNLEMAIK